MRGGVALLALVMSLAACSQPGAVAPSPPEPSVPPAAVVATPSPTPWPTVPPQEAEPPLPDGATGETADAIHTRWRFGLRSDLEWVQAVAADPDDWSMLEIPMTAEENRDFQAWSQESDRLVGILGDYGRAHPDEFGGIFVDQRRRRVATLWTANLDRHEAEMRQGRAGRGAPMVLYHVEHSESLLRELQDRVPLDDAFYAAAIAELTGVGVDIRKNDLSIDISSANPEAPADVRAMLATRLNIPQPMISVESDGTGVELLPFGQIEIHLAGPGGHRIQHASRLDWRYAGNQVGTCGPGGDMWVGFDERGVLRTSCNPGIWTITVTSEDGSRILGSGTAVVRADELTRVTITLDRNP